MRIYETLPIEATKIGDFLNKVQEEVALNPRIEKVTGHDFVVYLTYSYDSEDKLGWIFSPQFGVYRGVRANANGEWVKDYYDSNIMYQCSFHETEQEALKAQEKYEEQVTTMRVVEQQRLAEDFYATVEAPQPYTVPSWKERLKNLLGFNL